MAVYNIFVKLLDGTTTTLKFSSPTISLETLKQDLYTQTQILPQNQRLITGTHNLDSKTLITLSPNATIHLLGRLLGGKGGFGSLLRGAATKAGQKKTNNFDACRDMSGRRLRHVNSEKRLEEWKLEEAERKLEKIAEEFIKKKMKEVKKSGGGKDDKYFEKFNKESKDCREKMEASVKASFGMYEENKRKMMPGAAPTSKRLKLSFRMKEDESDSDSDEEDVAVLDEKSVVLNDANPEKRNKNGEGSSASVYEIQSDGESSGGGSSIQSTVEEEHGITTGGSSELGESSASGAKTNGLFGPESMNDADWVSDVRVHNDKSISVGVESDICQETKGPSLGDSSPEVIRTVEGSERKGSSAEANGSVDETTVVSTVDSDQEKPLNFDDYSSAAEMEWAAATSILDCIIALAPGSRRSAVLVSRPWVWKYVLSSICWGVWVGRGTTGSLAAYIICTRPSHHSCTQKNALSIILIFGRVFNGLLSYDFLLLYDNTTIFIDRQMTVALSGGKTLFGCRGRFLE